MCYSSFLCISYSHVLSGNIKFFRSCCHYVLLMVFLLCVSTRYWLLLSICTFQRCCIYQKSPTSTHPNFEKDNCFIILSKMDIFRDNCLSLSIQNNSLARTLTSVFSTAPCSHKFKINLWNIFSIEVQHKHQPHPTGIR